MRVAIIGLGLIGGSLGLAIKKRKWQAAKVIGWVRRPETGQTAIEIGAVDSFELDIERAVRCVDVVLIATPVLSIKDIFANIAPHLHDGCIVTDAASTKFQVMQWAKELLPPKVSFIGGHPMAGKETSGIKSADADLFRGAVYCLVQGAHATPQAMQIMNDMVETIGAMPVPIDAQEHDNLVAGISHLPSLLSVALTLATARSSSWPQMSRLAATGYRDLTRLASGNPEVNMSICLSNQSAILHWIDKFNEELRRLRDLVDRGDSGIQNLLTMANEKRKNWLESR